MNLKRALVIAIVGIVALPMIASAKPTAEHRIPARAKKLHFAMLRLSRSPHQHMWR